LGNLEAKERLNEMSFDELQETQNLGKKAELAILKKVRDYFRKLIVSKISFELPEGVNEDFYVIEYLKNDLELDNDNQVFFLSFEIDNICVIHAVQDAIVEIFTELIKKRDQYGILEVEPINKFNEDEKSFVPGLKVKLSAERLRQLFQNREDQEFLNNPVKDPQINEIREAVALKTL